MPRASKSTSKASPESPGKTNDACPGSRRCESPVSCALGSTRSTASIRRSREATSARPISCIRVFESRNATANATAPATFCVPDRRERSCPPPLINGSTGTRERSSSAPSPFGVPNLCPDKLNASTSHSRIRMGMSPAACTASTCSGTPCSCAMRAISLTGSTVPTSLLASIVDTSSVQLQGFPDVPETLSELLSRSL